MPERTWKLGGAVRLNIRCASCRFVTCEGNAVPRRMTAFAMAWIVVTGVSAAQLTQASQLSPEDATAGKSPERTTILGADFEIIVGLSVLQASTGLPQEELLAAIGRWVSSNFDLPPVLERPNLALVPAERMVAMRKRAVMPGHPTEAGAELHASANQPDILALYDDRSSIIYLLEDWSGATPAELSMLVHEMVHHIQNQAGLSFECPEAREKQAFAAQELWLAQFGTNLTAEFGIDTLTLFVRTSCFY